MKEILLENLSITYTVSVFGLTATLNELPPIFSPVLVEAVPWEEFSPILLNALLLSDVLTDLTDLLVSLSQYAAADI